ncbi:MAG: aspartate 1-decarboxylase [Vampirovibrionales bacterium]|nr:aspartate 1-decarboxylase [Vampirovibrionales bacterium]
MNLKVLYSKIHRATVTDAQLHYEGSITIDKHLMRQAGISQYQAVNIYNIKTGTRFETYVIEGEAHSGIIQVNGAAAHLAKTGDLIIIASYAHLDAEEVADWQPKLVFVDAQNRPTADKPEMMPV